MKINGLTFNPSATDASLVSERTGKSGAGADAFAQLFAAADKTSAAKPDRAKGATSTERKPTHEPIENTPRDRERDRSERSGRAEESDIVGRKRETEKTERRPRPSRPDEDETTATTTDPIDGREHAECGAEVGADPRAAQRDDTEKSNASSDSQAEVEATEQAVDDEAADRAAQLAAAEAEQVEEAVSAEAIESTTETAEATDTAAETSIETTASLTKPIEITEAAKTTAPVKPEGEAKVDSGGRPLFTTLSDVTETANSKATDANGGGQAQADAESRDGSPHAKLAPPLQAPPANQTNNDTADADGPQGPALVDDAVRVESAAPQSQTPTAAANAPVNEAATPASTPTTAAPTSSADAKPVVAAAPASGATGGNAASAASGASTTGGLADVDGERVAEQAMRGLRGAIAQKGGGVTLRLNPGQLGQLKIQVEMNNGIVRAQIHTSTDVARSLLQQQLHTLKASLEGHGLTVESLHVHAPAASTSGSAFQQAQDQTPDDGRSRGFNAQQQQRGQDNSGGDDPDNPQRQPQRFEQQLLDLVA